MHTFVVQLRLHRDNDMYFFRGRHNKIISSLKRKQLIRRDLPATVATRENIQKIGSFL